MRKVAGLLILNIILSGFIAKANTYYVSTDGNDSNPGTIENPFASWAKGFSVLKAGDILYVRGGTYQTPDISTDYRVYMNNVNGTSSNHIKILAYPGESPVLDFSNITQTTNSTGFRVEDCSWIDFKGLRITNLAQQPNGNGIAGWAFWTSHDMTFEFCEADHIGGTGFMGRSSTYNLTFINCDSHHNSDPYNQGKPYGDADGFDCIDGNTFYIGCRAWWNSDDGFDCFGNDESVTYKNCWAFWNGYVPGTISIAGNGNGFKWGLNNADLSTTVLRNYSNCLAFQNSSFGFDQNAAQCIAEFYNNTSYSNKSGAWATGYSVSPRVASVFKNNLSYNDGLVISDPEGLVVDHNSWNGFTITDNDFISLNSTGVDGPRSTDGRLPNFNFLKLAGGSPLIDAGTIIDAVNNIGSLLGGINIGLPIVGIDVDLPFTGGAPDLGAFEYSNETPSQLPVVNQLPVANAGLDINITLPTNNTTLTGSGTDADGSIVSYQWKQVSGPICTIDDVGQAQTTVSNLAEGIYVFEVEVSDNQNASAKDSLQIIVNPANQNQTEVTNYIKVNIYGGENPYNNSDWNNWNIRASMQSSEFNYTDGTASQLSANLSNGGAVSDNSSDFNGTMAPAEVLRYASYSGTSRTLTISGLITSKTYNIEFYASRVLHEDRATIFEIDQMAVTIATYNNFSNAATFTNLRPNDQGQIIINISSAGDYNNYLNGFMITENNDVASSTIRTQNTGETQKEIVEKANPIEDNKAYLKIYPNPVPSSEFTLEVNNSHTGKMNVQIIDQAGAIRHTYSFNKDQQHISINLNTNDLSSGVYFIRVQIGAWSDTRKLLKL